MRYAITLLFVFTFLCCTQAQDFKRHVVFLASDSLHGRPPGTVYEKLAGDYITNCFKNNKVKVSRQGFYFEGDSAVNVFGFINNKKDSTVIISAHYDHLGLGSNKSKEIIKKGIHHGADDNASGVAMMIELSKWLGKQKKQRYNYIFAAYSAHEPGLYGSAYFAKSDMFKALKVKAFINFDMVGRLDTTGKILKISGTKTDSLFTEFFRKEDVRFNYRFDDTNIPGSDLKPFAEMNIPVLHFTTGLHADYHRISDTEEKINYEGMKQIFVLLQNLLVTINKKPTKN
jgi:Zn-dependent M28 family amino/carboxypeptidase